LIVHFVCPIIFYRTRSRKVYIFMPIRYFNPPHFNPPRTSKSERKHSTIKNYFDY